MWWNFVARTREEILTAHADWTAATERFGHVASPWRRIEVDPPPWADDDGIVREQRSSGTAAR